MISTWTIELVFASLHIKGNVTDLADAVEEYIPEI